MCFSRRQYASALAGRSPGRRPAGGPQNGKCEAWRSALSTKTRPSRFARGMTRAGRGEAHHTVGTLWALRARACHRLVHWLDQADQASEAALGWRAGAAQCRARPRVGVQHREPGLALGWRGGGRRGHCAGRGPLPPPRPDALCPTSTSRAYFFPGALFACVASLAAAYDGQAGNDTRLPEIRRAQRAATTKAEPSSPREGAGRG